VRATQSGFRGVRTAEQQAFTFPSNGELIKHIIALIN